MAGAVLTLPTKTGRLDRLVRSGSFVPVDGLGFALAGAFAFFVSGVLCFVEAPRGVRAVRRGVAGLENTKDSLLWPIERRELDEVEAERIRDDSGVTSRGVGVWTTRELEAEKLPFRVEILGVSLAGRVER